LRSYPRSPHSPYTTLFRSRDVDALVLLPEDLSSHRPLATRPAPGFLMGFGNGWVRRSDEGRLLLVSGTSQKQIASSRCGARILQDRKSTRLNSSHVKISYA